MFVYIKWEINIELVCYCCCSLSCYVSLQKCEIMAISIFTRKELCGNEMINNNKSISQKPRFVSVHFILLDSLSFSPIHGRIILIKVSYCNREHYLQDISVCSRCLFFRIELRACQNMLSEPSLF
jgi:hypothetical protein